MVKLTGGGINSNKTVQSRSGVKVEPTARAANVEAVAQQGMATAFPKREMFPTRGYEPEKMPVSGVKGQYNAATSGPGSLRTTYAHGSQAEYGPRGPQPTQTRPMPKGREILSEYGPESPTSRGRGR
jgi:hypothetical protein